MELTIADRRRVVARARTDEAFRRRLETDGGRAIAEVTGVTLPDTMAVRVVEEPGEGGIVGALPRQGVLAAGLPDPQTVRDAWENILLDAVRTDPDRRATLLADPAGTLRALGCDLPLERLTIHDEGADETLLVIPHEADGEALDDTTLDLVAGGDQSTGGVSIGWKTAQA